jgi:hypothetical protein
MYKKAYNESNTADHYAPADFFVVPVENKISGIDTCQLSAEENTDGEDLGTRRNR